MPSLLILGATSDIARAVAGRFARHGWSLVLAGRDTGHLVRLASDLRLRYGCHVEIAQFDVLLNETHQQFWDNLPVRPDAVFCAVGVLGDQSVAEREFPEARRIIETNYLGVVSILNVAAAAFERDRRGSIMAVSSVAGDQGRRSNYIYGSAKAGLTAYLSGLRSRLHPAGVHVMTIKPGPVRTAMTEGMALPPGLTANVDDVADDIWRAFVRKRDTVYARWYWRYIMVAVASLPEPLLKRLRW